MEFDLKKTFWAMLLAQSTPISAKKFQDFVHRSFADRFLALSELRVAVEELNVELAAREAPERVAESPEGYFIRLVPEYAQLVRDYKGEPKPQKLTPAAMETLSIIAYRQPASRSQIEAIRGVSADGPISKLLELELIEGKPNDTLPGRPMIYTTTNAFLEQCGLKSLDELPQTEDSENEKLREFFQKQEEEAASKTKQEELPIEEEAQSEESDSEGDHPEEPNPETEENSTESSDEVAEEVEKK